MGRGSSGSGSSDKSNGPDIRGLKDSDDFRQFVKENMSNPEFKQYGRENSIDAVKQLWRERQIRNEKITEISKEEAIAIVRANIPDNIRHGWFVAADSDYKPALIDAIARNPGTFNAGLNIAYHNYREANPNNKMSFERWLKTPQTIYRGDNGQVDVKGDIFKSYTPDKSIAGGFGKNITSIRIAPINTWGSYQTTGEQEFLIPIFKWRKRK